MRRIMLIAVLLLICAGCDIGKPGRESQRNAAESGAIAERELAAASKSVTVFTARHYEADEAVFEAFTKKTGIKVNEVKGTAEELIGLMKRDGAASEADLFFTVDGGVLNEAKRQQVLKPMQSAVLDDNVPARWRDPDRYWTGVATRARVIVYAKGRVKREELSTYESLTDAKWKSRILVRSSASLYNQSLLASFIALNGEERAASWARGIAQNMARPPKGGDREQAMAIAEGVGDVAIMNTYYIGQLAVSDNSQEARIPHGLGVFFPNQQSGGTHVNISGIGLAVHAKNENNALKLVEFMTGPEGQTLLSSKSFEYPVNPKAAIPDLLRSWGTFKAQSIDFAALADNRAQAISLFEQAGWK